MKYISVFIVNCLIYIWGAYAQVPTLNGPMLGYNSPEGAAIWLQTHQAASVYLEYKDTDQNNWKKTELQHTDASNAFVSSFWIGGLRAGRHYNYKVYVDGKEVPIPAAQAIFRTQTTEKEPQMSIATGSCACLRDKKYKDSHWGYGMASGYGIYKRIAKQKLDYMLWMGDNIYLRNGEWNSFEGVCYRYTHTRSLPQMQPLLRATHHIATWDDHDYGMNNGNALSEGRDFALRGFQEFWKNPPTHPEKEKGLYYNYRVGDAEFFLTDDRLCRSPDTMPDGPDKAFLGKVQVEWLLEGLEKSDAHFKIIGVGTQVLNQNLHPRKEGYWKDYRTEATYLLSEIRRRKIEGVLFLTGDVHHTVLSKMETPGFYPLYDLTVSGFTSIQNPFFGRKNGLKVRGTFTWVHNFCVMKFIGSGENRRLRIEIRNKIGARIWKREIFANSLRVK